MKKMYQFLKNVVQLLIEVKKLIVISVLCFLTACQSAPPLNFSVSNVGSFNRKINSELERITVTMASSNVETARGSETKNLPIFWKLALTEALIQQAIFTEGGKKKLKLNVNIISVEVPLIGFDFTTKITAIYEITNSSNGDIIYRNSIRSEGTTPIDFAFLGYVRRIESVNRSAKNNINMFLQDLNVIDVDKP